MKQSIETATHNCKKYLDDLRESHFNDMSSLIRENSRPAITLERAQNEFNLREEAFVTAAKLCDIILIDKSKDSDKYYDRRSQLCKESPDLISYHNRIRAAFESLKKCKVDENLIEKAEKILHDLDEKFYENLIDYRVFADETLQIYVKYIFDSRIEKYFKYAYEKAGKSIKNYEIMLCGFDSIEYYDTDDVTNMLEDLAKYSEKRDNITICDGGGTTFTRSFFNIKTIEFFESYKKEKAKKLLLDKKRETESLETEKLIYEDSEGLLRRFREYQMKSLNDFMKTDFSLTELKKRQEEFNQYELLFIKAAELCDIHLLSNEDDEEIKRRLSLYLKKHSSFDYLFELSNNLHKLERFGVDKSFIEKGEKNRRKLVKAFNSSHVKSKITSDDQEELTIYVKHMFDSCVLSFFREAYKSADKSIKRYVIKLINVELDDDEKENMLEAVTELLNYCDNDRDKIKILGCDELQERFKYTALFEMFDKSKSYNFLLDEEAKEFAMKDFDFVSQ